MRRRSLTFLALLGACGPAGSPAPPPDSTASGIPWDERTAEHLYNRAGFGATPDELALAVRRGLDATVDSLFRPHVPLEDPFLRPTVRARVETPPPLVGDPADALDDPAYGRLAEDELVILPGFYRDGGERRALERLRTRAATWIQSMLEGRDPLRDRMTLFWHGHFVSAYPDAFPHDLSDQFELLRAEAVGNFATLTYGMARDVAMLRYLDTDENVRDAPNENWARELMELFTLGLGRYSEQDIKEASRAFTGWTVTEQDEHVFDHGNHDWGRKTVHGLTGSLNGDDVLEAILVQDACSEFVVRQLVEYLEGLPPTEERVESYAEVLREGGYELEPVLRRLFRDPEFYRDEIVGRKIAAPVEYFVGAVRRLGIEPPPDMVFVLAAVTGQRLFAAPNVSGWEEGAAWMATADVIQRGNGVGMLLGVGVDVDGESAAREIIASDQREFAGGYRDYLALVEWLEHEPYAPRLDLPVLRRVARLEPEVVAERLLARLLAVPPTPEAIAEVAALLTEWRTVHPDATSTGSDHVAIRLAHLALSLPEAQLL